MKKILTALMASVLIMAGAGCANAQQQASGEGSSSLPKVYFIKDITSENLIKIYEALGRKAEGKNVAMKLSDGKPKARMWQSSYRPEKQATPITCNLP